MREITGWHVLITILTAILIASLCANYGFISIVDNQQYRIESLENRLYELNVQSLSDCYGDAMENISCYNATTKSLLDCPQIRFCHKVFGWNEWWYEP